MCKKTTRYGNSSYSAPITRFRQWSAVHLLSKDLGFSLIDLLFTVTLASILIMLSFPVYKHLIMEIRLFTLTEQISTAVNYARSEAIRRRGIVTLCASRDGKTCSGRWRDGWIIFFDKKTMYRSENSTTLLRVYPALSHTESLDWRGSRSHHYLQWAPDGSTHGQNGSFIVCTRVLSDEIVWLIKVSQTGRLRIDKKIVAPMDCNY